MKFVGHIIFAVIGIVGACIWTGIFFYFEAYGVVTFFAPVLDLGKFLTLIGILGVVMTGIWIFLSDIDTFLESKKFIANMVAAAFLFVVEGASYLSHEPSTLWLLRVLSVVLWTWVFGVAVLVSREQSVTVEEVPAKIKPPPF